MATLSSIRTALATRLQTADATDLRVYERIAEGMQMPCVALLYAGPVDGPYATFGGNAYDEFTALLVTQANDLAKAQEYLDDYMSKSGSKSLQAAIEADQTLGGVVDFALFNGWEEPGQVEFGDVQYHAARCRINVYHT
jgi:hypothetical protein